VGANTDTLDLKLSGLGYLVSNRFFTRDQTGNVYYRAQEQFAHDDLGNLWMRTSTDSIWSQNPPSARYNYMVQYHQHEKATGRLLNNIRDYGAFIAAYDSIWYDEAGNVTFTYQGRIDKLNNEGPPLEDRASFYDPEGRLRAADMRKVEYFNGPLYRASFEEYRYDALGRRVWVRARPYCSQAYSDQDHPALVECSQDLIRRIIWDGDQELWEIQMPGQDTLSYQENDTVTVNLPRTQDGLDLHGFYGRVLYTHGPGVDRPLAVTRIGYVDFKDGTLRTVFQPFTIVLVWSVLGDPTRQYTAENLTVCNYGTTAPCVYIDPPVQRWAYGAPVQAPSHWHGTLLENKSDRTGTQYRRNRYYDPATGRFTQEDPIGLAGGINLYGYANGDPVSYTDPFGLCPPPPGEFDPLCSAGDLAAGFGDAITFGLTRVIRERMMLGSDRRNHIQHRRSESSPSVRKYTAVLVSQRRGRVCCCASAGSPATPGPSGTRCMRSGHYGWGVLNRCIGQFPTGGLLGVTFGLGNVDVAKPVCASWLALPAHSPRLDVRPLVILSIEVVAG